MFFFVILTISIAFSCNRRTDGNIVGSWKNLGGNEDGSSGVTLSSTIVYKIAANGNYTKTTVLWIGDTDNKIVEKGYWKMHGDYITFTITNNEKGGTMNVNYKIEKLTDDRLTLGTDEGDKFKYERVN